MIDHASFRDGLSTVVDGLALATTNLSARFEVSTRNEDIKGDIKRGKWGGLVRDHSRSLKIAWINRAHTIPISRFIVTVSLSCTFFWDIARYWSKIANVNIPHLYLAPRWAWPRSKFAEIFGVTKHESLDTALFAWSYVWPFWYSAGLWRTDRQTDRQTDTWRHHIGLPS